MFAVAIIPNRRLLRCLPVKGKATNFNEEPDLEVYREIRRTSMEPSVENCWNQEYVLHLLERHVRNICKIKNGLVVIYNASGRDPSSFNFDYEYFLCCRSSSPLFLPLLYPFRSFISCSFLFDFHGIKFHFYPPGSTVSKAELPPVFVAMRSEERSPEPAVSTEKTRSRVAGQTVETSLSLYRPVVTIRTTRFNAQNFHILPTQYIYVFCIS